MHRRIATLLGDDDGATMIEYALIITLLAMTVLLGATGAGSIVANAFSLIGSAVANA
jgi:Flp pilus assembly pilin Flp